MELREFKLVVAAKSSVKYTSDELVEALEKAVPAHVAVDVEEITKED